VQRPDRARAQVAEERAHPLDEELRRPAHPVRDLVRIHLGERGVRWIGGERGAVPGAAQGERDLAGHLRHVPSGQDQEAPVERGAGPPEPAVQAAHRAVPGEGVEQLQGSAGRTGEQGAEPVGVPEHGADPGGEPFPAAPDRHAEEPGGAAQVLGGEPSGAGAERTAQAERRRAPTGHGRGEDDPAARAGPGDRAVVEVVQPAPHLTGAHPGEGGEPRLAGRTVQREAGLDELQGGEREIPDDLQDGDVVDEPGGEGAEVSGPGRRHGVRAVDQDPGEPVLAEGRQPAEEVMGHRRSLRSRREAP